MVKVVEEDIGAHPQGLVGDLFTQMIAVMNVEIGDIMRETVIDIDEVDVIGLAVALEVALGIAEVAQEVIQDLAVAQETVPDLDPPQREVVAALVAQKKNSRSRSRSRSRSAIKENGNAEEKK
ncbi:hypothetical protein NQ318_002549 [Aromia moschata]|uniref:Uncharacterized protein n=1 Tax=Aromia moschata TaxID=1265417 RepID=A0AAV8XUL8_9CUCU|nr:hypothetical protein NQ318_002549 [Aromia moschata]